MLAYAVFAGGGVKGAALAGCLAAAQDQGVDFVGFGGTSAGSIVALLASVGYAGVDIGKILIETDLTELLDDGGASLAETRRIVKVVIARFEKKQYLRGACAAKTVIQGLWHSLGLYSGDKLKKYLLDLVEKKAAIEHPTLCKALKNKKDFSFDELVEAGGWPLRVVASDIAMRKPVIFPRDQGVYGALVINAVRASAGFPFVFRPVQIGDSRVIDGGIASNLPSFLFANEFRETRVPTLAFDLITNAEEHAEPYNLMKLGQQTLYTSLDASDEILRGVLDGVVRLPVRVPSGIDTLDFWLPRTRREELYHAGYSQASSFLTTYEPLRHTKEAGEHIQQRLMARFGSPKLFFPILYALVRDVQEFTKAKDVRAQIMLGTGRKTRIVVYHYGMDNDTDVDLELKDDGGCTGLAWATRAPSVADLEAAAKAPEKWKMTQLQQNKVRKDRRSMLSAPIPTRSGGSEIEALPPIGTISVDSSTPLDATSWLTVPNEPNPDVVSIITGWAQIVARVLP